MLTHNNCQKIAATLLGLFAVMLPSAAFAGVTFYVDVKEYEPNGMRRAVTQILAEGNLLAVDMQQTSAVNGAWVSESKVIFRGDRNEMIVVDHRDRSYMIINSQTIQKISVQLQYAKQMAAQAMQGMSIEQRALLKRTGMQNPLAGQMSAPPMRDVRRTSDRRTVRGHACTRCDVFTNGKRTSEIWVTDWQNIEGGREFMAAFEQMSYFVRSMTDAIAHQGGGGLMKNSSLTMLKDLRGFPVASRDFTANGTVEDESALRSARRMQINPAEFTPPAGYKLREMFDSRNASGASRFQ